MTNDSDPSQTPNLATVFAALGDPTRLAIVERLLGDKEVSAGDIGAEFSVSAPSISRHLGVLHRAGIVQRRTDRQRRLYSVAPEAMKKIATWTLTHQEFWGASLIRLDALMALEEYSDD